MKPPQVYFSSLNLAVLALLRFLAELTENSKAKSPSVGAVLCVRANWEPDLRSAEVKSLNFRAIYGPEAAMCTVVFYKFVFLHISKK